MVEFDSYLFFYNSMRIKLIFTFDERELKFIIVPNII